MKLWFKNGQGSIILRVRIMDTTSVIGAGKTGLTFSSSGLVIATLADNESSGTVYSQAGSTIETITTLGTFAAPTATKCRFKEVDSTNFPGLYEIQIADARWAVSGARSVIVSLPPVSGLGTGPVWAEVQLTAVDPQDAQRFGLVSLPNANPGAANGIFIAGSNAATTANITGNLSGNVTGSVGSVTGNVGGNVSGSVGSVASSVTVGANNDKTGYALTAGEHANIATDAQTGLTAQGYTTGRAPNLDNLNATVSSRSSHSVSDIWSYLYSAAGALGSDTLGKMFANLLGWLTQIRIENLDNLDMKITDLPTVAEIVTGMDDDSADLNTIIAGLGSGGSVADILGADVPDAYPVGTLGYNLGLIPDIKAKTDGISVGTYNSTNPFPPDEVNIPLAPGTDYLAVDGRAFTRQISGMPDFTGGSGEFVSKKRTGGRWSLSVDILASDIIQIEFPRTESIYVDDTEYEVFVTLANGDVIKVLEGMTERDD